MFSEQIRHAHSREVLGSMVKMLAGKELQLLLAGSKIFECSAAAKQVTKERNDSIPNCKKIRLRRLTRSLQLMEL